MSYIRTKDNIYEEQAREKRPDGCVITTSGVRVPYTDILLGADSIEALCHCYSCGIDTTSDVEVARNWKLYDEESEVYGCIKTCQGLIYVARMNEDGELELL